MILLIYFSWFNCDFNDWVKSWCLFVCRHLKPIHLRPFDLRPHSFQITFVWDLFIWDHIHTRPHSYETTFIWDHIHLRPIHLRPLTFETTLISTTFIWDLFMLDLFIWDHIYMRPHSYESTFMWGHIHLWPWLFETTIIWDLFIWDHILTRPHSFEITFVWVPALFRPHSHATFSFETTFILCYVKVNLFWFTVNHIFIVYLPLLCGRPEVLQDDSSFEVLQGYALPCPWWLTLGCKCTWTL